MHTGTVDTPRAPIEERDRKRRVNEVGSDGKWGVVLLDTRPYSGLAHGTQGGSVRVLYTQTFA